jgi:hypothetical protein
MTDPTEKKRTPSIGAIAEKISTIRLNASADAERAASEARQKHYQSAERRVAKLLESLPTDAARAKAKAAADAMVDAEMVIAETDSDPLPDLAGPNGQTHVIESDPQLSPRLLEEVPAVRPGERIEIERDDKGRKVGSSRK